jgi:uncharacterized protein YjhX (UPF0386 family)
MLAVLRHWGCGVCRSRLRNEDDGGQRRRLRKNDAAPRDGLGGQTSTVELLRRIRRQKCWRMRAGRPERACDADLVRCTLSRSAREDSAISGACAWQIAANFLRALL